MTQEEFDRTDERMPYFALVWASAGVAGGEGTGGVAPGRPASSTWLGGSGRAGSRRPDGRSRDLLRLGAAGAGDRRGERPPPAGPRLTPSTSWSATGAGPPGSALRPDPGRGRPLRAAQRPGRRGVPGRSPQSRRRGVDRRPPAAAPGAGRSRPWRPSTGWRWSARRRCRTRTAPRSRCCACAFSRWLGGGGGQSRPEETVTADTGLDMTSSKWIIRHGDASLPWREPLTGDWTWRTLYDRTVDPGHRAWRDDLADLHPGRFPAHPGRPGLVGWASDAVVPGKLPAAGSAPSWPASSAGSSAR